MREFVSAIVPFEVEVDGRLHLVERPSVAQALTVMASCEAVAEGSPEAWVDVRRMAYEWLPIGLSTFLMARTTPREYAAKKIIAMISMNLGKRHDDDEADVQARAQETGWFKIISTYAHFYHMAPAEVMAQPWPLFVGMMSELDRLRALDQIDNAGWYISVKNHDIDDIHRRAYGDTKPKTVYVDPPQEWYDRQNEAIRVWKSERERKGKA